MRYYIGTAFIDFNNSLKIVRLLAFDEEDFRMKAIRELADKYNLTDITTITFGPVSLSKEQ